MTSANHDTDRPEPYPTEPWPIPPARHQQSADHEAWPVDQREWSPTEPSPEHVEAIERLFAPPTPQQMGVMRRWTNRVRNAIMRR